MVMSAESATATGSITTEKSDWLAGGVSGFVAGIPFGLMIQFVLGAIPAIGALYTMPGVASGWIAHLFHSVVFGLVFVGIMETDVVSQYTDTPLQSLGAGLVYGAVLWIIFLIFIWPIWLNAVGFPKAPSVPYIAVKPLIGHLVYGGVLGAIFPWVSDWV